MTVCLPWAILFFACPKKSMQKKRHPGVSRPPAADSLAGSTHRSRLLRNLVFEPKKDRHTRKHLEARAIRGLFYWLPCRQMLPPCIEIGIANVAVFLFLISPFGKQGHANYWETGTCQLWFRAIHSAILAPPALAEIAGLDMICLYREIQEGVRYLVACFLR